VHHGLFRYGRSELGYGMVAIGLNGAQISQLKYIVDYSSDWQLVIQRVRHNILADRVRHNIILHGDCMLS
jgi:hypothetical protein